MLNLLVEALDWTTLAMSPIWDIKLRVVDPALFAAPVGVTPSRSSAGLAEPGLEPGNPLLQAVLLRDVVGLHAPS